MAQLIQIPLRNQVRDRIAEQLWSGVYSFGDDLNEARLAEELGVSRTPLREGLVMLVSEGLIEARPNRGFHVPSVDPKAVAELYQILGTLESLAVETSTGDLQRLAKDLDRINSRLKNAKLSSPQRNGIDADWHTRLIANCPNDILRQEISVLRARSRCIDGALFRGLANVDGSSEEHRTIAQSIGAGELKKAARLVHKHWRDGISVVTTWIEETTRKSAAR